jgi:ubiquinone/menaquinone biosynthesis C-methylase UbiE
MKTEWDYTTLADAYLNRPDYADTAIEELLRRAGVEQGQSVCDVGAGTAHLTIMLAHSGLKVVAVEPNDAMRGHGIKRTASLPEVRWHEGVGEETGQATGAFRLVTFGSSFNVTDRPKALIEASRILASEGWFACMWNHRDLDDPIQSSVEAIIRRYLPSYDYGTRREDQTQVITDSQLFEPVEYFEGSVRHRQDIAKCIEAWRSHGTLQRQAGPKFAAIVEEIGDYLHGLDRDIIEIPYVTRVWAAQKRA